MATHRFLCVIMPPPELAERVIAHRDMLHGLIGHFSGRNTPPHITLFFADLPEELEDRVRHGIAAGTAGRAAFTLRYGGMAHFPDRRTIYIDPMGTEEIAGVRRPIVDALRSDPRLRDAVRESDHPHLTIAAGLRPDRFSAAWSALAPHGGAAVQEVREVVLLKRLLRPGERYAERGRFPLGQGAG